MVLICPPIFSAQGRDDFNRLLERLGGKALDLKAVRNRRPYMDSLTAAERQAYHEAHQVWSRELGDPKAALDYLENRDIAKARLSAGGTTRATIPHDLPGEGPARLSPAAQGRRQEMREAIDRTAAQILPKAASVRLVENIRIADGRAEARALAYKLRKGEIKEVDFTTKYGKDYFASFEARDDEGNLYVQVFPADAMPARPGKPATPHAAYVHLDYMGLADPAVHGYSGPRYEVGLVETMKGHRRLGVASALYDTIEQALGIKMVPSGVLFDPGYKFWRSRNPELLRGYQRESGDTWTSPKQIWLGLEGLRTRMIDATAAGDKKKIASLKDQIKQYEEWWKAVPQDLKAQNKLDAMFSAKHTEAGLEALGRTDPYTMTISLAARAIEAEARARGVTAGEQAEKVLRHEGVEFFKALGLINSREWSVLENAARREGWVDSTGVRDAYSQLYRSQMSDAELEQLLVKEAIAEQYSEYHLGRKEFSGMIGKTFERIKDFLMRAMNALRGMGFQKWEDVFDRIDRGEFKQRFEAAMADRGRAGQISDMALALRAYHGSPHDFERFDLGKIGTGEGAQVYGHGLYFAENPDVARSYRMNADSRFNRMTTGSMTPRQEFAFDIADNGGSEMDIISNLARKYGENISFEEAQQLAKEALSKRGVLYNVSLDVEPHELLDWDKPLSEQSPEVQAALAKLGILTKETPENAVRDRARALQNAHGLDDEQAIQQTYHDLQTEMRAALDAGDDAAYDRLIDMDYAIRQWWDSGTMAASATGIDPSAGALLQEFERSLVGPSTTMGQRNPAAASDALREAGIPGIRYLDQGSRGQGEGASNYVIFDDSKITITHKNGEPVTKQERTDALEQMHTEQEAAQEGTPVDEASGRGSFGQFMGQRGINVDQNFALRQQPSPLDQAFADIRAELGLGQPDLGRKGKPTPRQQLAHIALEGAPQILKLHGEAMAPFLAQHQAELEAMALPLSVDPLGDGFKRFFREFIMRPDDLRQRQAQAYDNFADLLDAETPQLLEAVDKMQTMGRDQLAERRARATQAAAGGAGGRQPPQGPNALAGGSNWKDRFHRWAGPYIRTFQPELVSASALEADPLFAAYRAGSAQEKDMIVARGEELYEFWNKQPEQARLDFLRAVDMGEGQPTPQLAEIAWRYRQLLDRAYRDEVAYGSRAGYLEDYLPRLYKDEAGAQEFFAARSSVLGPTWFQKHRYYELLDEARAAGHELKTTNPEELVALRLMAGVDMRQRMELLQGLERMGLARQVDDLQAQVANRTAMGANGGPLVGPGNLEAAGWQLISAPDRKQWMISPDVQPLWKNAVEAKGLWADPSAVGSIFRGWMIIKNAWVPVKLTLSAFHPMHVLFINMANDLARGFSQARSGDLGGAWDSFLDAFTPTQGIGRDARHAWLKPYEERTPEERDMVDMMIEGGFSPQISEQLRIAAKRNLQKAMEGGWTQYWKVPFNGLRRVIERTQAPIFERWIPGLKAAAYLKEAQALFERRPDLYDDATQRRVALRAIAKSVDNRFGEMFYSTLFWNRYVKDAGIGSFLSLGWQLGLFREGGGAAIETISRQFAPSSQARQTIRDATNKRAMTVAYVGLSMLLCGAMTYAFTGEAPGTGKGDGYDFIFPRVGGQNPDGSQRRLSTMQYTREVPMAIKHIEEQGGGLGGTLRGMEEMLWNKMMFQPFTEIAENRDYWGYEIFDPHAPLFKQMLQVAEGFFSDQGAPISIAGAKRARDLSGTWWDKSVPLSVLGFGPAPAYAERSAIENRIRYLYQDHVAALKKPYAQEAIDSQKRQAVEELKLALQKNDLQAAAEARKKAMEAGAKPKYLTASKLNVPSTYYLFSRLGEIDQRAMLEQMSPAERNNYRRYAKQKLRREFPAVANPSARPAAPEATAEPMPAQ